MKNKFLLSLGALLVILFVFVFWVFSSPNTQKAEVYIKTGDGMDSLHANLDRSKVIKNGFSFKVAQYVMKFKKIYPGKYVIMEGMTNRQIINLFKYGRQTEIEFRFGNNIRPYELYAVLGRKFEADSADFAMAINNKELMETLGLDSNSVLALFWADTYKFPWAVLPDKMVRRFFNEHQLYWNTEKFNKLPNTGLKSAREVYILASIIEKEAMKKEELPIMAGVYINRLNIGMPLQADPTNKYATGDKTMRRIKGETLKIISPYNTYDNKGLPPGPIGIVTKVGIEAVLNFQQHDYLYFCAKEDFSNTHYFTKSYAEHLKNAAKYRAALDSRGIR
ncbi:MAG: endolytic transglycosylase MltG [Bacteroidia bacterium]